MSDADTNKQQKSSEEQVAQSKAPEQVDAQVLSAILQQIEFYFGNSNYPNDKFLKSTAAANDGWVPIAVLLTFNRLNKLSKNADVIADAIAESDVVALNEARDAVQRKEKVVPLDTLSRTLWSSGYPDDVTWETVAEYWKKHAGDVAATRLVRKKKIRTFMGAAFIEFASKDSVEKVMAEGAGPFEWGEGESKVELKILRKAEYLKEESEKRRAKQEAARVEAEKEEEETEVQYTAGCIIKLDGLGIIPGRDDLKDTFEPYGDVDYVDYGDEAVSGFIRFSEPDQAQTALDAFAGGRKEIFGKVPELSLLEGDAEKEYWVAIRRSAKERYKRRQGGRRFKGKRRR